MTTAALAPDVIARLPTPKGVAMALVQACRSDDVNLQQIAELVRTDPALSGRLLALANSAAAGGRNVVSIDDAVSRTGLVTVSQIALAFSLIDQHSSGFCANFNYAGFWSQSILMAAASREFGTLRKMGVGGELFTLGLLAQVGRLALATAFAQEYSELLAQDFSHAELLRRERALAGQDRLELSVTLMTQWGIEPDFARPFGLHEHAPTPQAVGDPAQQDRSALAHTAWQVARALTLETIDDVPANPACQTSLAWLNLDAETLRLNLVEIDSVWRLWLALISRRS